MNLPSFIDIWLLISKEKPRQPGSADKPSKYLMATGDVMTTFFFSCARFYRPAALQSEQRESKLKYMTALCKTLDRIRSVWRHLVLMGASQTVHSCIQKEEEPYGLQCPSMSKGLVSVIYL